MEQDVTYHLEETLKKDIRQFDVYLAVMSHMDLKSFIKKHGWVFFMAFLMDGIAYKYWSSYLMNGSVYDGKHGITFIGESAFGHLSFATLGAIVFSYFAGKLIYGFIHGK